MQEGEDYQVKDDEDLPPGPGYTTPPNSADTEFRVQGHSDRYNFSEVSPISGLRTATGSWHVFKQLESVSVSDHGFIEN